MSATQGVCYYCEKPIDAAAAVCSDCEALHENDTYEAQGASVEYPQGES